MKRGESRSRSKSGSVDRTCAVVGQLGLLPLEATLPLD